MVAKFYIPKQTMELDLLPNFKTQKVTELLYTKLNNDDSLPLHHHLLSDPSFFNPLLMKHQQRHTIKKGRLANKPSLPISIFYCLIQQTYTAVDELLQCFAFQQVLR